ncbi:SdpI family protein [Kosakonia pseudosacchari]|uniref:SdpI family protein n=1 Tax=Kosakonia pseudosacchari TaxID=1646340 RepID=UPI0018812874|nr:SdpI family protein [Kosakonia pseudosacchari]QOV65258.1 SdpI family protein [Kosakonia pseudosacchari]WBU48176.1 SdpI family protein [Kosakonia pseudosacchari]
MNDIFLSFSVGMRVLMAVATPLARQRIEPNRFYGVRTALTLRDDAAWYRANRPFGKVMLACGAGFFLFPALPGHWRENADNATTRIVLFLLAVSVPVICALINASREKRGSS